MKYLPSDPVNKIRCYCLSYGQGEQILRLAEMCRKLETEEEKVLPFYPSSLSDAEKLEAERASMERPSEQLAQVGKTAPHAKLDPLLTLIPYPDA